MSKYKLPKDGGLVKDYAPKDIIHRYERMATRVFESEYYGVQYVADSICRLIKQHYEEASARDIYEELPPFVLGLTTGRTPLGLYRELVKRHRAGEVSFRNVAVYSLDEFYPIQSTEQQSRNYRIHDEFLKHIDILPENVHIIDGTIPESEVSEYCANYDKSIRKIDLMIIGFGEEGQVGFNEQGSYAKAHTRLVELSHNSRKIIAGQFFGLENTPKMAITMGIGTILRAERIVLMAWGEDKANAVKNVVENAADLNYPASFLQTHPDITCYVDETAASLMTRVVSPWLVGPCDWTRKFIRKAVVWLCQEVHKPILKLTLNDYLEHSLGELIDKFGPYDKINIEVFNDLQHTITGWPGGKPNADDSQRPVPALPFPKTVLIFSPHPDDDVISMGGTFIRLVHQGHNVHVAYETSGDLAVHDDVVLQHMDAAHQLGFADEFDRIKAIIDSKKPGEPEPKELLAIKGAIRRSEARGADRSFGLNAKTNVHFLNLPFYESGGVKKLPRTQADLDIIKDLLKKLRPDQVFMAGDLADPHGTHRVCTEAALEALEQLREEGETWIENTQG